MDIFIKLLDAVSGYMLYCIQIQEVKSLVKSRANYFKERRATRKDFGVLIERQKLLEFEKKLKHQNKTKTAWLDEKIDEELKK